MTTAQLQIQQALVDALQATPAVASGRIYTNHLREVSAQAATAVTVTMQRSAGFSPALGATDWRTSYQIDCLARASTTGSDPAAAVDELLATVYTRLSNLGKPPGLALMDLQIDPQISWDYADGATPIVAATITVQALHRTADTNLSPWA